MDAAFFMRLALDAAWRYQGLTYPNPAVGCAVVDARGALLSVGAHQRAGGAHAEVFALKNAYMTLSGDAEILEINDADGLHDYLLKHHKNLFNDATLYVTLEPCSHVGKTPSCASLICALGLKKVVIASKDPNGEAAGGMQMLQEAGIETECGFMAKEGAQLLLPFVRWQKGRFIFFKWAQRLDGSIDGGTVSSIASRTMVHAMRERCDLLVIGGNTVRCDRPTLDARLVKGKAPDILILSHENVFDWTIPLFNVPGRKVMVAQSLELLAGYKNIMIEGGPGMLASVRNEIDCALAFVASKTGGTIPFTKEKTDYEIMHARPCGNDMMIWMRGE